MQFKLLFNKGRTDEIYTMICKFECDRQKWDYVNISREYPIVDLDEDAAILYNLSQDEHRLVRVK